MSDIERSIVFYRDVLGMTLVRRRPKVDADYVGQQTGYSGVALSVASFQVSQESKQTLEVVQYLNQGGPPIEPATNRAGSSHLCLLVSDFHVCHADLAAKGAAFKSEPVTITEGPNEGGVVIYLSDPGRLHDRTVSAPGAGVGMKPLALFDLTGKVAVVTGAAQGLGEAIAGALSDHGARTILLDVNAEAVAAAAERIASANRPRRRGVGCLRCHRP